MSLDSFVALPFPHDLYLELVQRYPTGASTVVQNVVQDFLDRTAKHLAEPGETLKGVQWDALLLPHGTQARTKYFGEYLIAEIVDGKIMWKGKHYRSMSQLARAMRSNTSNNAWVTFEIKRPTDTTWRLADRLRN
jgi:hypothetical protein